MRIGCIVKSIILVILLTLSINAVETCEYVADPSGFVEISNQRLNFKLNPNETDAIIDFASIDIQPTDFKFLEDGKFQIFVDESLVPISRDMDASNEKTYVNYDKDETKFKIYFIVEGKNDFLVKLRSRIISSTTEYLEWSVTKKCTESKPADLTVSALNVRFESGISHTYPRGTFKGYATISNLGDDASPSESRLDYYLSTNTNITTSDIKLYDRKIGNITEDRTFDEWLDIPSSIATGTYYYGACTQSFTGEGDTNNNCSTNPIEIVVKKALSISDVESDITLGLDYKLTLTNNMSDTAMRVDLYQNGNYVDTIIATTPPVTNRNFSIDDAAEGSGYTLRVISLDDANIYEETNEFTLSQNNPVVTEVIPASANLNEETIFTVKGSYLTDKTRLWIDECDNMTIYHSGNNDANNRYFQCTPSYKGGVHNGEVYAVTGGASIKDFTVDFIDNRPTYQLNVAVTDIGGASGQVSSSPIGISNCREGGQGTCQAGFKDDEVVITAHTDDNSKAEFPNGCTKIEGNQCTVPMLDDNVINVKFTPIEKRLKIKFDSDPQNLELNPNEKLNIDFKVTDSPSDDNIVDLLQVDKYGDSSNVVNCKTNFNMKDVVTCEVFYPVVGDYTLTAMVYDENLPSNMLSLNIKVTNDENRDKFTGHQNPEHLKAFWTNNPQTSKEAFYVDTATGTQNLQLNFLQQFGQIDLNLGITYNSGLAKDSSLGHLGKGWSHSYGMLAKIEKINNSKVLLRWSDTRQTLFVKGADDIYRSANQGTKILASYYDELTLSNDGGYELKKNNLTQYKFNSDSQLVHIINSSGEKLFLTYTDNKLFQVLEPVSGIRLKYYYNNDGSIDYVKDVSGHTIAFKYDSNHRLFEITDADETIHSFAYNSYGELTSYYIDKGSENFRYFTNVIDELGRVKEQKTKEDHITKFDYNEESANTIITTVTTPRGNTRKYKYNSTFQLLKYFDELDNLTENTYTDSGLLHTTKDPMQLVTEYFYNAYGKLSKTLYPNDARIERGYTNGGAGHIDNIRDESINTIRQYHYEGDLVKKVELNVKGDVKTILSNEYTYHYPYPDDETTKVIRSIITTTAKGNKNTTFYTLGRVSSVVTHEGVKTVYTYNDTGTIKEQKLYTKSGSLVGTSKFEYDLKGRIKKVIDAENNIVEKTYSVFGGIKTLKDAKGKVTEYSYDLEGNIEWIKDAKGNFSYFYYDDDANLLQSTDAEGKKHYVSYDAKGRKDFEFNDAKQEVAEYDYDSLDAIKKVYTYDDNNQKIPVSEHSYDIPSRTTTTKSHLGKIARETTEYFDTRGRITKYLNSARGEKEFTYENHFNTLTSVTNEMLETASQTIDNEGNIETLTDTNTNLTSFKNDSTPNITEEKSALNKIHQSTYNAHQLLESFTNARGQKQELTYYKNGWLETITTEGKTWSFVYDANGNVLTINGHDGTITRTYNELNQITSYTDILGETQQYTYDKVGNLLTLKLVNENKVTAYTYDSENRMSSVSFDGQKVVDYTYTRAGKLKTEKWANGITRTYVYHNGVGELQSISDKKADGTVIVAFTFEYDALGNIVKESKTVEGETETFEHTYDSIGTLLESKIGSETKAHYSSFASVMLYDQDNRVKSIDDQNVSYDADGNMLTYHINSKDRVLEFDAFGRLTKANGTLHEYDIENNKVKTTHKGKSTQFTTNPNAKLSQLLVETLPNGDKTYHVYGIGLVASISKGQTSYYHFDYRGSTLALSNSSGNITDSYKYLVYGKMVKHSGTSKTRFLYVGKYGIEKEASGLYYMRARYYDTELKRFVSKDSLIGNIANSKSLNRYAYVEGNPVMGIDVSGNSLVNEQEELFSILVDNVYDTCAESEGISSIPICTGVYTWGWIGGITKTAASPFAGCSDDFSFNLNCAESGVSVFSPAIGKFVAKSLRALKSLTPIIALKNIKLAQKMISQSKVIGLSQVKLINAERTMVNNYRFIQYTINNLEKFDKIYKTSDTLFGAIMSMKDLYNEVKKLSKPYPSNKININDMKNVDSSSGFFSRGDLDRYRKEKRERDAGLGYNTGFFSRGQFTNGSIK